MALLRFNLYSVIAIIFTGLLHFSYSFRITDYKVTYREDYAASKKLWRICCYFIVLQIVWQYLVLLWFPPSLEIAEPWLDWGYTCSGEDDYSTSV